MKIFSFNHKWSNLNQIYLKSQLDQLHTKHSLEEVFLSTTKTTEYQNMTSASLNLEPIEGRTFYKLTFEGKTWGRFWGQCSFSCGRKDFVPNARCLFHSIRLYSPLLSRKRAIALKILETWSSTGRTPCINLNLPIQYSIIVFLLWWIEPEWFRALCFASNICSKSKTEFLKNPQHSNTYIYKKCRLVTFWEDYVRIFVRDMSGTFQSPNF